MSVVALVIACVTAAVVNEQARRVNLLEGRLMEIETHFKDLLELTLANNEYDYDLDFNDDYQYQDDEQVSVCLFVCLFVCLEFGLCFNCVLFGFTRFLCW